MQDDIQADVWIPYASKIFKFVASNRPVLVPRSVSRPCEYKSVEFLSTYLNSVNIILLGIYCDVPFSFISFVVFSIDFTAYCMWKMYEL